MGAFEYLYIVFADFSGEHKAEYYKLGIAGFEKSSFGNVIKENTLCVSVVNPLSEYT